MESEAGSAGSAKKTTDNETVQKQTTCRLDDNDIEVLREKFPFLKQLSTNYIKGLTPSELLNMEKASMKRGEQERFKDAEDRLTTNRIDLGIATAKVMAGVDDRWAKLHNGRFLAGAGCSASKLWLTAREVIGVNGYPAISTYDMAAVGLAGYITPRGWLEAHNPSSSKMSIRLFNVNNITSNRQLGRTGLYEYDEPEDYSDLGEFQLALRAMRAAISFIMPWNHSVAALEGFLLNSRYCRDDIGNLEKQAQLLTNFCDFVTRENASRWRNVEPFINAGEMRSFWNAFFLARPQSQLTKVKKPDQKTYTRPQGKTTGKANFIDICFHWNRGQCNRAAGACTSKLGTPLRHVCDQKMDRDNPTKRCEGEHQRCVFHK
jgi:hypothetical protein